MYLHLWYYTPIVVAFLHYFLCFVGVQEYHCDGTTQGATMDGLVSVFPLVFCRDTF